MKQHMKSILKRGLAVICITALLSGCNQGIPSISDAKENKMYSMPEIMLVVANERNRYEKIYTEQIWDVAIDEQGTTFKRHLLDEIKRFLEELRTINLLAEEKEITLSEQEKETLRQLARDYYGKLTEKDRAYILAEEEDVYNMYQEYHLANKVVEELTKDINLEISDSEAKVITIMEIRTSDAAAAQEAFGKIQEEGSDFASIARTYSEGDEITMQIGRGEHDSSYDQAAFALAADEVSQIVRSGSDYYIFKCVSDYDEEKTQERKQRLSQQRRSQAFRQIYDQFAGEHQVTFDDNLLSGLVFSPDDQTTATNFFKMYQDYMTK